MVPMEHKDIDRLMSKYEVRPFAIQGKIRDVIVSQQIPSYDPPLWLITHDAAEDLWAEIRSLWDKSNHSMISDTDVRLSAVPKISQHAGMSTSAEDLQISDPSLKPTNLPEDHPTHMLLEARRFYRGPTNNVPFILNKRSEKVKNVVIPTIAKKRPEKPVRGTIVLREWDTRTSFWTLDLNDKRLIVKHMNKAPKGGVGWYWWPGPSKDFIGPVALSEIRENSSVSRSSHTEMVDMEFEDEALEKPVVLPRISSKNKISVQLTDAEVSQSDPPASSLSTELQPEQRNLGDDIDEILPSAKRKLPHAEESTHQMTSTERTSDPSRLLHGSTSSSQLLQLRCSSCGIIDSPPPPKRKKTEVPGHNQTQLRSISPTTIVPSCSPKEPMVSSLQRIWHLSKPILDTSDTLAPMLLPKYKQDSTRLRIFLDGFDMFRGRRFRACPTFAAFFALISKAWDISQESIKGVTVIFDWMQESDKGRKMVMKSDDEEDFELLLEEVANASVWDSGIGRCAVDVHIQREIQASQSSVKIDNTTNEL